MKFMDENFLLYNSTARELYRSYSEKLPIIDYHCHVSPKQIYEDASFTNITQLWLYGDHYKWRLMRSEGISEYYITGEASDKEKFFKFASVLSKAIGNPMYHWCHLELRRYFGYEGILNSETAQTVWELTQKKLRDEGLSVRKIIEMSNVAFIGTTDDPVDTLEYHKLIKQDKSFGTVVAPSFRPDKALNLNKEGFADYIRELSSASGVEIRDIASLKQALAVRMRYFDEQGCRASDHGLDFVMYGRLEEKELDSALGRALNGEKVSEKELAAIQTELLLFCGAEYKKMGWVMQLHYNCLRNPNSRMLSRLGADTGFDIIGPHNCSVELTRLLDEMYSADTMPRMVLYSLDSTDNSFIDTLIGAFQQQGYPGTLQHGSAWWFNDTMKGMREQLTSLASLSLLGNFVGMLTDSRSFLSYTRHEYFRRILCSLLGEWVERGEYPEDMEALGQIASDISFYNAKRFFELEELI